jgi:1-acyl-sn-glycerol-3-phosphate acyltransferase
MRLCRAFVRLSLYALWCAFWIPIQWIVLHFTQGPGSLIIPLYWHKVTAALFGIRVEVEGSPVRGRQVVLVSNHLSYLDIEVFSRIAPWSFVAKAEVARWPLFGTLARLQQTAFTSRARTDAHKDRDMLGARLAEGKNLIIFAEGTSSDGGAVLPFKSSVFGALKEAAGVKPLLIQPVTLVLLTVDGRPCDQSSARDLYAYHGDMVLAPHLWRFAGLRGARLRMIFHEPIEIDGTADRKQLALRCHEIVASGLARSFSEKGWLPATQAATMPAY